MGKVVLITGAKQGIGFGIAEAFAKEGYNLIMADIDFEGVSKSSAVLSKKYKVKSLAVMCDISDKKSVEQMIEKAKTNFGKIDILVNNAGIYPFKAFSEMSESDWDKVINVNLKGVFFVIHESLKLLKKGSSIVNISSIAGLIGYSHLVHYCASKAGIIGLTRSLALELSPNIRVNAIAPGAVETPGTAGGLKGDAKTQTLITVPLKRIGKPEDIGNAAVFLGSDKSSYITGHVLVVDGGWTVQ